jgi:hypothetical protein
MLEPLVNSFRRLVWIYGNAGFANSAMNALGVKLVDAWVFCEQLVALFHGMYVPGQTNN